MIEAMVKRENMLVACQRVKGNQGSCGIDGMTVEELKPYLLKEWARIKEELLSGDNLPQSLLRVEIPKAGGKGKRKLDIPTAVDRLIQQALHKEPAPVFEPGFS